MFVKGIVKKEEEEEGKAKRNDIAVQSHLELAILRFFEIAWHLLGPLSTVN